MGSGAADNKGLGREAIGLGMGHGTAAYVWHGLAENSVLPGKLGELAAAMAENLDAHMQALDLDGPISRQEYDKYLKLANDQRKAAATLLATAHELSGARDLPIGPHDFKVMSGPQVLEAFEKFVKVKQELLALL